MTQMRAIHASKDPSLRQIPRFFFGVRLGAFLEYSLTVLQKQHESEEPSLRSFVNRVARIMILDRKQQDILDVGEYDQIWKLLSTSAKSDSQDGEGWVRLHIAFLFLFLWIFRSIMKHSRA